LLKVNLISIASYKLHQKLEVNFVSRSDTMDTGTPCSCTIPEFYDNPYLSSIIIESLSPNIFQKLFPCASYVLTFLISPKHLDNNYQFPISYIKISYFPL
jgi:hypothetical protein